MPWGLSVSGVPALAQVMVMRHRSTRATAFTAAAVNALPGPGPTAPKAVHPHVRGEHGRAFIVSMIPCGSSPRPRRTPLVLPLRLFPPRFIPASAENTGLGARVRRPITVHPRVRGEHLHGSFNDASRSGSSPRPRRTLALQPVDHPAARFIPASAENTAFTCGAEPRAPVHPRVRGEHSLGSTVRPSSSDSSPRPRRTPSWVVQRCVKERFIPASAENTSLPRTKRRLCAVHPRVRGEHGPAFQPAINYAGSSPRPRRTHPVCRHHGAGFRFIPASAENTD